MFKPITMDPPNWYAPPDDHGEIDPNELRGLCEEKAYDEYIAQSPEFMDWLNDVEIEQPHAVGLYLGGDYAAEAHACIKRDWIAWRTDDLYSDAEVRAMLIRELTDDV